MATIDLTQETFETTVLNADIALVDFWAAWCGPCRQFAPTYEAASEKNPDIVFGKVDTEAERQLARIGMAEHMHEQAGNLALGPQRLMEIARALCADPTLLLLDEPAAGLRFKEKEGLAAVLRQLRAEGAQSPQGADS